MGWVITLGILVGLALLPIGIGVAYSEAGFRVKLHIGPIHYSLYPKKKRKKQEQPERKAEPSQPKASHAHGEGKQKAGGSLKDFLPLVKTALELLKDLRRKIRVKELYLRLILASSEPADLAMNYGRTWTALGNLMPQLEQLFVIRKRDVEVECDFTASETTCIARVDVTITLGRLLVLTAVYGIRALKEFNTIQKNRKGGAAI